MLEPINDRLSAERPHDTSNLGDMLFNLLVDINHVYAASLR
jgi:hypothetical protein